MPMIKEKLIKTCQLLHDYSSIRLEKIDELEMVESGYKVGHTPPDGGWEPLGMICGAHKHFWIRGRFTTPAAREGITYILKFDTGVGGRDMLNPQGILYLNGKMVQGIDTNHMEAYLLSNQTYEMYLYLYTAYAEAPFFLRASLMMQDDETDALYYDLLTPLEALEFLNPNTTEYQTILSKLEKTVNLIDLRAPHSKEYTESIHAARAYLKGHFYDTVCSPEGKPVVHCIGHTHIDMEWRWERKQTREKIQRSFATAAALMNHYPEYRFMLSQPELYLYLKEEAPEKYEELKELVRQGRWEPEGAMWVECDCNLVCGESFVRQILYGKRFFREEFGVDSTVLFLPDVFGYSAALPQILKKSGIDYFVTSKISWNETNTMPYDSFFWKGLDGTEIFSTFITAQSASPEHRIKRRTAYSGDINAKSVMGTWDRYQQKEFNQNTMITFGYGDGGGGPTRQMLEKQRRLKTGIPGLPVTKMNFLLPYLRECEKAFAENTKKLGRTPRWSGELYLEYHRGTYTTMAKNKRMNRKCEFMLKELEAVSYTDLLFGGRYDAVGIDRAWKILLHDQFHDILPGTSVKEVYDWTDCDYEELYSFGNAAVSKKLQSLAEQVKSSGGVLVYNPLGFPTAGTVLVNGRTLELTEPVPAFGWKVMSAFDETNLVQVSGLCAENPLYLLKLDACGNILSLYDKAANREIVLPGEKANAFSVYEDHPYTIYEAWDIGDYYRSKQYVLEEPAEITAICDGTRRGFLVKRKYMDSTIIQKIWLYSRSRRIDFETEIDWHQKHQLLKVAFPFDIHTDNAVYETQYGHVVRPTHSNTSWDSAKFEVCGHKWVDMSEYGYGVSLLNDCKYGFSANGSTLELTVLKRPTYPNPDADEGKHVFTYSLLPHLGDFREAGVIREAYLLNQGLEIVPIMKHSDELPAYFSLVSCDCEQVMLDTVKKAENGTALIVRLYEAFDSRCNAEITVTEGFREAYLCDLMENELEQIDFDGRSIRLPVKNFEIVTLKFK